MSILTSPPRLTRHLSDHHAVQGEAEYVERHAPVTASPGWQPIETAPHETLVVLGWYEGDVWKQEIALASAGTRYPNGCSDRWQHGRATHWMPLPAAPEAEGGKMQSKEMPERDARRDIGILLAQIDWLQECTGETLEAEDAALLHQIRRDWSGAAPDAPEAEGGSDER